MGAREARIRVSAACVAIRARIASPKSSRRPSRELMTKKLVPRGRKKLNATWGWPMKGRRTQPICAPTSAKRNTQMRNTRRTLAAERDFSLVTSKAPSGSGGGDDGYNGEEGEDVEEGD